MLFILNCTLESLERSAHRRVTGLIFAIKAQAAANGDSSEGAKIVNSGRGEGGVWRDEGLVPVRVL